MLSLRLKPVTEKRLNALAKASGRTKTFYVRTLIEEHLDDLEDIAMAERRLKAGGKRLTLAQVRKNLGLDN